MCQSLFLNKVVGLRAATLLKKRLWRRCFPMNFAKFLRTPFLQNTSGRLLLLVYGLISCLMLRTTHTISGSTWILHPSYEPIIEKNSHKGCVAQPYKMNFSQEIIINILKSFSNNNDNYKNVSNVGKKEHKKPFIYEHLFTEKCVKSVQS